MRLLMRRDSSSAESFPRRSWRDDRAEGLPIAAMCPSMRRVHRVTAGNARTNRNGALVPAETISSVSPRIVNLPPRRSASKYFVSCVAIGSGHIIRVEPIAPKAIESPDMVTGAMKRLHEPLPMDLPGSGNASVGSASLTTTVPERLVSRHEVGERAGACKLGVALAVTADESPALSVAPLGGDVAQPVLRAARQSPISQRSGV